MLKNKPPSLKLGDTIAIISPSWGGPSIFPHIYENGLKKLYSLGFKVKEYPTARMDQSVLNKNPQLRAKDINDAFADKKVNCIVASIGGEDSIRILPHIDKNVVLENPKIIMGYSDTDTILTYLNQLGLITFHGPSVMAGFSQMDNLPKNFESHFKRFFLSRYKSLVYRKYSQYCDGYPNWKETENTGKTNQLKKNTDGWHWLQGKKIVKGELFGGCIEVLEKMAGTKFWPNDNFWNNKILFFETSEEKPSIKTITRYLKNYSQSGIFKRISSVLFGRARDFSAIEKKDLDLNIRNIINNNSVNHDLPIITNMDFGHTDPQLILPLGVEIEVNPIKQEVRLNENPFAD
ncbi:LD-carboxypeptidase [Patescibacteria group bacterium]|nr:LD-carboxypeptidase [Patescibacteria group bacterium]MBU1499439.1 LD-carboxypeptidase [Patescibacteria group bacterium]